MDENLVDHPVALAENHAEVQELQVQHIHRRVRHHHRDEQHEVEPEIVVGDRFYIFTNRNLSRGIFARS